MMAKVDRALTRAFTRALPKAELHAHLTGSISGECLHDIWLSKQASGQCLDLEDPLTALKPGGSHPDVLSFFPLFDRFIYRLVSDVDTVKYATKRVIRAFEEDGVVYLELRTTPRENAVSGLSKEGYVRTVLEALAQHHVDRDTSGDNSREIEAHLVLSIDRRMTADQAMQVIELASHYGANGPWRQSLDHPEEIPYVVGVDLCGNPTKGDVALLTPAFQEAKRRGLKITVHFAEVPHSSTETELSTLLSWMPDRLGHVIHVSPEARKVIERRRLGLELCLSCNVLAKLTTGGFAMHQLGHWMKTDCPIALSTDDVGIFDSPLSNEYLLAAEHFDLDRQQIVALSKSAMQAAFSGTERMLALVARFESSMSVPKGQSGYQRKSLLMSGD